LSAYSWSKFGREAEYITALYLKSRGWDIRMSKGSRGPADVIASRKKAIWFIQVKASRCVPRLKGYEVQRLIEMAYDSGASPVVATLQPGMPKKGELPSACFSTGNFSLSFYLLDAWKPLDPR
jgi:Holliday junction resolvase